MDSLVHGRPGSRTRIGSLRTRAQPRRSSACQTHRAGVVVRPRVRPHGRRHVAACGGSGGIIHQLEEWSDGSSPDRHLRLEFSQRMAYATSRNLGRGTGGLSGTGEPAQWTRGGTKSRRAAGYELGPAGLEPWRSGRPSRGRRHIQCRVRSSSIALLLPP